MTAGLGSSGLAADDKKGYKIKIKGKDLTGHIIGQTDTYIILHDAVTREHIKVLLSDIDDKDIVEVDPTWLKDAKVGK